MIGEALFSLGLTFVRGLFSSLNFITIPTDALGALSSVLAYGNWVVGIDILAVFAGTVVFWWGVHLSIGLAVWLWNQLPLT